MTDFKVLTQGDQQQYTHTTYKLILQIKKRLVCYEGTKVRIYCTIFGFNRSYSMCSHCLTHLITSVYCSDIQSTYTN